ncbi:MAG: glycosyltransferase, partial [Planctomycetia bacterium]|nr:glycosyltransferase [Planctomycetia bacterium]
MDPDARDRPLRIAHVTLDGHLPRYGIGLAVVSLARALARGGHDVTLLCRPDGAREVAPSPRLRVVPLARPAGPLPGSWAYARAVRAALAPGVDVVHVHGLARMAWWLRGARARRGAPLVLTA